MLSLLLNITCAPTSKWFTPNAAQLIPPKPIASDNKIINSDGSTVNVMKNMKNACINNPETRIEKKNFKITQSISFLLLLLLYLRIIFTGAAENLANLCIVHLFQQHSIRHITRHVQGNRHGEIGQRRENSRLVDLVAHYFGEKCWHLSKHGVEAPIFSFL